MSSVFSGLHESLRQVLAQRLEWTDLREVQEQAYLAAADGSDVLVIAPTAGGKSEAALIPVMDDILKNGRGGVTCLYISPLKALINDQEERFRTFCTPTALSVMKWHGDVARQERSWKEGEPPDFLMITPESLEVLLRERELVRDLRNVRTVIIDELHAFVESERGVHLKVLLDRVDTITQRKVQRIGLSATAGNPKEVLRWLSDDRHAAKLVAIPAVAREKQFLFVIEAGEEERIAALARIVAGRKALVFVNSRSIAESVMAAAAGRIRNLHIHHSSLSPSMRKAAEASFSSGEGACIICTSTLELGIDIGDLDVVVQVGPPNSVSSFLQRMGRSGRRGSPAYVAWILRDACELLCSLAVIECAVRGQVEDLVPPARPYNALVQQVFLEVHRHLRISRRNLGRSVMSHAVFRDLGDRAAGSLISFLVDAQFLTADGEMLMMGTEAERRFGRSNWKDLYSVIRSSGEYRAVTPDGDVIGKLDAQFVSSRNSGEVLLGGQAWTMVKCDEDHHIIVVVPGGTGQTRTFWTGSPEGGLSPLICRMAGRIHARGGTILPLGDGEREVLDGLLARIPPAAGRRGMHVMSTDGRDGHDLLIYSFSGSRFNRLLAYLLKEQLHLKTPVQYNDFMVRVTRAGKDEPETRVMEALRRIQVMKMEEVGAALPAPPAEGWKFAGALPYELFSEMVLSDFYHVADFQAWVREAPVTLLPARPGGPGTRETGGTDA